MSRGFLLVLLRVVGTGFRTYYPYYRFQHPFTGAIGECNRFGRSLTR